MLHITCMVPPGIVQYMACMTTPDSPNRYMGGQLSGRLKVHDRVLGEGGWVGPQRGQGYRLGQGGGAGCGGADGNLHRGEV